MEEKQFRLASTGEGRIIFGLCSGVSNYTGISANLLRFGFAIAFAVYGIGIVPYVLLSLLFAATVGYSKD